MTLIMKETKKDYVRNRKVYVINWISFTKLGRKVISEKTEFVAQRFTLKALRKDLDKWLSDNGLDINDWEFDELCEKGKFYYCETLESKDERYFEGLIIKKIPVKKKRKNKG